MVGGGRKTIGGMLAAAFVLVTLAGCASAGGTESPQAASQVTLAQSKSYAQLLRNEASSRLPEIVLKGAQSTDVSVACDGDPDGLERSWNSSMSILITNSTAPRIHTVADDLAASFVAQGWTSTLDASSTDTRILTELTSEASLAAIEIEAALKAEGQEPSIRITATGVCALTGGPESDEVLKLEQQEQPAQN
jgi:hypothetical protein